MSELLIDNGLALLLDQVGRRTGESPVEAVRHSLEERLERLANKEVDERLNAIREIQERVAAMPVLDPRSADEILGYNEHGLFD